MHYKNSGKFAQGDTLRNIVAKIGLKKCDRHIMLSNRVALIIHGDTQK